MGKLGHREGKRLAQRNQAVGRARIGGLTWPCASLHAAVRPLPSPPVGGPSQGPAPAAGGCVPGSPGGRFLPALLGGRPAHLAAPAGRCGEAAQTRWSQAPAGPPARLQSPGVAAAGEGVCLPSRSALPDAPWQGAAPPAPSQPQPPPPTTRPGIEGIWTLEEQGRQGATGLAGLWYPLLVRPRANLAFFGGLFSHLCEDSWTLTSWISQALTLPLRAPKQLEVPLQS